ncbi:hypothetical protein GCM10009682_61800 [Luedemannella flava]|uniref:DUF3352 domain-containing protein n=1 Tax=Luedemannella flava TaxID=349316 RepID=A0ABN2MTM5_9ACTN
MTHPDAGAPTPDGTVPAAQPPADPWASPTTATELAPGPLAFAATDVLATDVPPAPRRRFGPVRIALAAGVVLALLVGVGAYAASMLSPDKRPEEFTPATVVAFAGLDLAASLEQQIKLLKVAKDLPEGAKDGKGFLEAWLKKAGLDGVDVKRDIISWLDKRVAVSLLPNGKDEPYALIAAATNDDAKAVEGLKRVDAAIKDTDLGFVVRDGGALIAIGTRDAQAAATRAADEAARNPLSSSPAFKDAAARLDDDQLLTVWADFGAIGDMVKAVGEKSLVQLGDTSGTLILGVRATTDGFDARYHLTGTSAGTAAAGGGDALAKVAAMPGDTQIGAATKLPDTLAANNVASMLFGGLFGFGAFSSFGDLSEVERVEPGEEFDPGDMPGFPGLTEAENKEIKKLLAKDPQKLTKAESDRLDELTQKMMGSGGGMDYGPDKDFRAETEKYLKALSGAAITVAVTHAPDKPAARIVAETTSADAAATLKDAVGSMSPTGLVADVQGNTVTATTEGYTAGAGKLGDKPEFQRATAGGPANANTVLYVDLATVAKSDKGDPVPVKTIALVQATTGDTTSGLLRLIIA